MEVQKPTLDYRSPADAPRQGMELFWLVTGWCAFGAVILALFGVATFGLLMFFG